MPRGVKKEVTYTGKAAKINEKILKLEADLKAAKEELKAAYKEQLKEEKRAAKEAEKEKRENLIKALEESGKSTEEILEFLKGKKLVFYGRLCRPFFSFVKQLCFHRFSSTHTFSAFPTRMSEYTPTTGASGIFA